MLKFQRQLFKVLLFVILISYGHHSQSAEGRARALTSVYKIHKIYVLEGDNSQNPSALILADVDLDGGQLTEGDFGLRDENGRPSSSRIPTRMLLWAPHLGQSPVYQMKLRDEQGADLFQDHYLKTRERAQNTNPDAQKWFNSFSDWRKSLSSSILSLYFKPNVVFSSSLSGFDQMDDLVAKWDSADPTQYNLIVKPPSEPKIDLYFAMQFGGNNRRPFAANTEDNLRAMSFLEVKRDQPYRRQMEALATASLKPNSAEVITELTVTEKLGLHAFAFSSTESTIYFVLEKTNHTWQGFAIELGKKGRSQATTQNTILPIMNEYQVQYDPTRHKKFKLISLLNNFATELPFDFDLENISTDPTQAIFNSDAVIRRITPAKADAVGFKMANNQRYQLLADTPSLEDLARVLEQRAIHYWEPDVVNRKFLNAVLLKSRKTALSGSPWPLNVPLRTPIDSQPSAKSCASSLSDLGPRPTVP